MVTGRLEFKELEDEYDVYEIYNSKKQHLGNLMLSNDIGKEQWLFYPEAEHLGDTYFATDCLIEIANKLKELNS